MLIAKLFLLLILGLVYQKINAEVLPQCKCDKVKRFQNSLITKLQSCARGCLKVSRIL